MLLTLEMMLLSLGERQGTAPKPISRLTTVRCWPLQLM